MRYSDHVHETAGKLHSERPRERLFSLGVDRLSDTELLALLIGSGIHGSNVDAIASRLLELIDRSNRRIDVETIRAIPGIGKAKAAQVTASLEFARRLFLPDRSRIRYPKDILPFIRHYSDRKQEHFLCLSLNGAHEIMHIRVVSIGLVNRTIVHPREVYAEPLQDRAAAVIAAHNHPSGNVEPSPEDREITERLRQAGETLGVRLLDHIVFAAGWNTGAAGVAGSDRTAVSAAHEAISGAQVCGRAAKAGSPVAMNDGSGGGSASGSAAFAEGSAVSSGLAGLDGIRYYSFLEKGAL
jgi:DNA repair protein RadC